MGIAGQREREWGQERGLARERRGKELERHA